MTTYGCLPSGWRIHNVSMGGVPSWIKTFEVDMTNSKGEVLAKDFKRRVILCLNPFSGKWFWQTTGTQTDAGKGDDMEYDDPVACAVVCEMTFGSTKTYEPVTRSVR